MISFMGDQFPEDIILFAMFFYVRYTVSYRDLEEIMAERGVEVDHVTLNRWVEKLYRAIDKFGKTLDFASRTFGSCSQNGATRWPPPNSSPLRWT